MRRWFIRVLRLGVEDATAPAVFGAQQPSKLQFHRSVPCSSTLPSVAAVSRLTVVLGVRLVALCARKKQVTQSPVKATSQHICVVVRLVDHTKVLNSLDVLSLALGGAALGVSMLQVLVVLPLPLLEFVHVPAYVL